MEPNIPQISEQPTVQDKIVDEKKIASRIFVVRCQQVMLDTDIAELFEVPVKRLNEQMKRNLDRFPEDFCFQTSEEENHVFKSQFHILKPKPSEAPGDVSW